MKRLLWVVALVACGGGDPKGDPTPGTPAGDPTTTGGTTTGSTTTSSGTTLTYDPTCADAVVATTPEDGRLNVFYRSTIEFRLAAPPTGDEVIVLREFNGEVAGVTTVDGNRVVFTPDLPLAPLTVYNAQLEDCPPSAIDFRTSPAGEPIDPPLLVGTTYAADVASGTWIQPPGAGPLLASYLLVDILVGVIGADATTLTVIGGVSEYYTPTQDLCAETVQFPPVDFSENPYLELGPQDLSLLVLGADLDLYDVHLTGAFRPDFLGIEGATLDGTFDTRGLVPLVVPGGPDDAVCQLIATFGVACSACPDGMPLCIDAVVEGLLAPSAPGTMIPRTAYDIAIDPTCP